MASFRRRARARSKANRKIRSLVVLLGLSISWLFSAAQATPKADDDADDVPVKFKVLATDEPVTTMAMTEDGLYLVLAHQAADLHSVWDVKAEKMIKSVEIRAPRDLLCRGDGVYVANNAKGTITVLSIKNGWKPVRKLTVERPMSVHMSAPQGKYFKDELIVTCHDSGGYIYRLDAHKSESELLSRATMATVSYDGKLTITQESFNQSPSGQIAAFAYDDFLRGIPKALYGGGSMQTPYVYQAQRGSYWIGPNIIDAGNPIVAVKELRDGNLIFIPDVMRRQVYALSDASISARQLNTDLTVLASRKVTFPPQQAKDFARVFHQLYRHRGYTLDNPLACTHDKDLYLFVIDQKSNAVLYSHTAALGNSGG
jgi:hypothetical protein